MKHSIIVALIALTLLFSAATHAQEVGYELSGSVVASGALVSGGDYAMNGAMGQPDTGTLSGGDYSLGGGIFGGGTIAGPMRASIYLPLLQQ